MSEAYNVICLFSIVRPKDSYDASKRCLVKKSDFAGSQATDIAYCKDTIYSCIVALPILEFCCALSNISTMCSRKVFSSLVVVVSF